MKVLTRQQLCLIFQAQGDTCSHSETRFHRARHCKKHSTKYNNHFSELHHKKIILLAVFFTKDKSAMQ
jgi:hypothetical protein